jgi:hypothetical protein
MLALRRNKPKDDCDDCIVTVVSRVDLEEQHYHVDFLSIWLARILETLGRAAAR